MSISMLREKLSPRQRNFLKNSYMTILAHVPFRSRLDTLAIKHGTDKWQNHYTKNYEMYFSPLRKKWLNLLEIGVGGGKNPQAGGASLRMWQDYFPRSTIYGIDIFDKRSHEDKRIKIFQGDQNDPAFLKEVATGIGKIDIIIDDGSHINEHIITSFHTLFPYLVEGGIYVIEDLATSYWPVYGGSWKDLNHPNTSMSMLKSLIDGLNYKKIPNRTTKDFDAHIVALHFYPSIAFIVKGKNDYQLSEVDYKMLGAGAGE